MKELYLEHGKHNEDACEYLKKGGKYNDWVITTAFYSAVHFANHFLFPQKTAAGEAKTVSEYKNQNNIDVPPHNIMIDLVKEFGDKGLFAAYKGLYDMARSTRYLQYKCDDRLVGKAMEHLKTVKEKFKIS